MKLKPEVAVDGVGVAPLEGGLPVRVLAAVAHQVRVPKIEAAVHRAVHLVPVLAVAVVVNRVLVLETVVVAHRVALLVRVFKTVVVTHRLKIPVRDLILVLPAVPM